MRGKVIPESACKSLYGYIWGIIKKKGCLLYRINGVEDHLHIVCEIHPSISVADFMRDIKTSSSKWMKESGLFPGFRGWSAGYGIFSYAKSDRNTVINYVIKQKEHHRRVDPREEFRRLLDEFGVTYDERYLT